MILLFWGSNGINFIDNLLLYPKIFQVIVKFIVCNFKEVSDHSPLAIQLAIVVDLYISKTPDIDNSIGHGRLLFKRKDEFKNQVMNHVL